jgi:hypothetical protein
MLPALTPTIGGITLRSGLTRLQIALPFSPREAGMRTSLLLLAIQLCIQPTLWAQKEVSIGTPRPESPKTVTFRFVKLTGSWKIERLSGFQVVLQNAEQRYLSSPIKVQDGRGICKISDVSPGKYKLEMQILRMTVAFTIPALPVREIGYEVTFGDGITIRPIDPDKDSKKPD